MASKITTTGFILHPSGGFALFPSGTLTSSIFTTSSTFAYKAIQQSASFVFTSPDELYTTQLSIPSQSAGTDEDVILLYLTSSGPNPRVGIGTNNPLSVFDFKDVEDSNKGTELLLRSSRTSKGAEVGDSAGILTFAIDSSSFGKIKTSGSIATIESIVTDIDSTGATGELVFNTADSKTNAPTQRVKIGTSTTEITGALKTNSSITTTNKVSSSTAETSGFLSAGSLGVGTTISPGASNLKVEGNAEIDGNSILGSSAGDNTTVSGSLTVEGTSINVYKIGNGSSTDNVAIIDNGYLRSASVDDKIFANPNTLVSRNAPGAATNQIPIYTSDTTILTGSNSLLFNPSTSTLTAPGFTSTTDTILVSAKISAINVSTTSLTASTISASGTITADSFVGTVTTSTTASYVQASNVDGFDTSVKNKLNSDSVVSQSGTFTTNEFIVAAGPYSVTSSDALVVNPSGGVNILGGLEVGPTLQFQTQSTPPTAVAGALYVDSNNNLYIGQ